MRTYCSIEEFVSLPNPLLNVTDSWLRSLCARFPVTLQFLTLLLHHGRGGFFGE